MLVLELWGGLEPRCLLGALRLGRVPQKCSSPETWSLEWDSVPEAPESDLQGQHGFSCQAVSQTYKAPAEDSGWYAAHLSLWAMIAMAQKQHALSQACNIPDEAPQSA